MLQRLYAFQPPPQSSVKQKHQSKTARNRRIIARYERGDTLQTIAVDFGISHQRVHQIIQRWTNEEGGV